MSRPRLSHYLRTERLRSGLTQRELGELFGVSRYVITKAEGVRPPPLQLLLLLELAFGSSQREIFPGMYAKLRDKLLKRAAAMEGRFANSKDPVKRRKSAFLGELIRRSEDNASEP